MFASSSKGQALILHELIAGGPIDDNSRATHCLWVRMGGEGGIVPNEFSRAISKLIRAKRVIRLSNGPASYGITAADGASLTDEEYAAAEKYATERGLRFRKYSQVGGSSEERQDAEPAAHESGADGELDLEIDRAEDAELTAPAANTRDAQIIEQLRAMITERDARIADLQIAEAELAYAKRRIEELIGAERRVEELEAKTAAARRLLS